MTALVPNPGNGRLTVVTGTTVAGTIPGFVKWLKYARHRSEHTQEAYGFDLTAFAEFLAGGGLTDPRDVTVQHVEVFVAWLQETRGVKPTSANRALHAVRTYFSFLHRQGVIMHNPAADALPVPTEKRVVKRLTIEQQEYVLSELSKDTTTTGHRDHAAVAVMLLAGLRVHEVVSLKVDHLLLDVDRPLLRIVNSKGMKSREVPCIPRLREILRGYLAHGRAPLLARPLGRVVLRAWRGRPGSVYMMIYTGLDGRRVEHTTGETDRARAEEVLHRVAPPLPDAGWVFARVSPTGGYRIRRRDLPLLTRTVHKMVVEKLSVMLDQPVYPHLLRHSFASRLRENDAPLELIQEALGHAQLSTTLIYAKISSRKRHDDVARYMEGAP